MLNWIKNIITPAGKIIDDLHTSDEEKLEAKRKLEKLLHDNISARCQADMASDSWLSKNVRPLMLISLSFVFVLITFFDGNVGEFNINPTYIPVFETLLTTAFFAYFGGRSLEKGMKIYRGKNE